MRTYRFHRDAFFHTTDYLPKPQFDPFSAQATDEAIDRLKLNPNVPAADSPEADQIEFIKQSSEIMLRSLHPLEIDIPQGTLFAYDVSTSTLAVRTSREFHQRLADLANLSARPKLGYPSFRLEILATDAAAMQAAVAMAETRTNHNSILTDLEKRVDQGLAQRITSLKLDSMQSQRAHLTTGEETIEITDFSLDEKFRPTYTEKPIKHGVDLNLDTVVSKELDGLQVDYEFAYDYAPVEKAWTLIPTRGRQPVSVPVYHRHKVSTSASLSMSQDSSRLLAVWSPDPFNAESKILQAAFLRGNLIGLEPAVNQQMEQILTKWSDKISPAPKTEPAKVRPSIPEGMELRTIRIPAGFFGTPSNPEPTLTPEYEQKILISLGAEFPPGATVEYFPNLRALIVKNTPENLHRIEMIAMELVCLGASWNSTVQIIQADGAFIRQLERETATTSDHTASWKAFQAAAAQGKVQFLSTAQLSGKSGQRAKFETGEWRMNVSLDRPPAPPTDTTKEKEKGSTSAEANASEDLQGVYQADLIGTSLEIDPVVGENRDTVDLNLALSYDYAPPTESVAPPLNPKNAIRLGSSGPTFHRFTMNTSLSLLSGQPRLLSIWKPEGKPAGTPAGMATDILQAAFIRVDVLRDE